MTCETSWCQCSTVFQWSKRSGCGRSLSLPSLVTSKRSNLFTHLVAVIVIFMRHHLARPACISADNYTRWLLWCDVAGWTPLVGQRGSCMVSARSRGVPCCLSLPRWMRCLPQLFIVDGDPPHDVNSCCSSKHDLRPTDRPRPQLDDGQLEPFRHEDIARRVSPVNVINVMGLGELTPRVKWVTPYWGPCRKQPVGSI